MKEWKIEYKDTMGVTKEAKIHADLLFEALEEFVKNKDNFFINEIVSAKEYTTPYYYRIRFEGDECVREYHYDIFEDLMNHVSGIQAFSDLDPEIEVFDVYADGRTLEYFGWLPNMRYVWIDVDTDEVVWDCDYPEWDH